MLMACLLLRISQEAESSHGISGNDSSNRRANFARTSSLQEQLQQQQQQQQQQQHPEDVGGGGGDDSTGGGNVRKAAGPGPGAGAAAAAVAKGGVGPMGDAERGEEGLIGSHPSMWLVAWWWGGGGGRGKILGKIHREGRGCPSVQMWMLPAWGRRERKVARLEKGR